MQTPQSRTRSSQRQAHFVGVVLLLLMYMAQPVLAFQSALCGCSGMISASSCASSGGQVGLDKVVESRSCCSKKVQNVPAQSCCAGGDSEDSSDSESVCHCPTKPVDSAPSGVVFDWQNFEGPFAWWSVLEGHANDWTLLAPHLGGLETAGNVRLTERLAWPPGGNFAPDRGPTGSAARRLLNRGLIAFLADLSVANL